MSAKRGLRKRHPVRALALCRNAVTKSSRRDAAPTGRPLRATDPHTQKPPCGGLGVSGGEGGGFTRHIHVPRPAGGCAVQNGNPAVLSNLGSLPLPLHHIRKSPLAGALAYLAERGGFEPPMRYKRMPDFESGTFNHSATSPGGFPARAGPCMIRGAPHPDKPTRPAPA